MSIRREEIKICSICWSTNKIICFTSMYISEADLDGNSIWTFYFYWVNKCNKCWYCNIEIDKSKPWIKELVKSEEYNKQLHNRKYLNWVNELLCGVMVNKLVWYYVHCWFMNLICSWMYLDENPDNKYIKYFKNEAIRYFEKDIKKLVESWNALAYLDTLRQLWDFTKAEEFYQKYKDNIIKEYELDMINMIEFDLKLISKKDSDIYTSDWIKKSEIRKDDVFQEYTEDKTKKISFVEKIKNIFK